jgi:hypothetical protein
MSSDLSNDAARLLTMVQGAEVPPDDPFRDYDARTRQEVVDHLARAREPRLSGRVIARLAFLETAENRDELAGIYAAHTKAVAPEVRAQALSALHRLPHPAWKELALAVLDDEADSVTALACVMLTSAGKDDEKIRSALDGLRRRIDGQTAYPLTSQLLARG